MKLACFAPISVLKDSISLDRDLFSGEKLQKKLLVQENLLLKTRIIYNVTVCAETQHTNHQLINKTSLAFLEANPSSLEPHYKGTRYWSYWCCLFSMIFLDQSVIKILQLYAIYTITAWRILHWKDQVEWFIFSLLIRVIAC